MDKVLEWLFPNFALSMKSKGICEAFELYKRRDKNMNQEFRKQLMIIKAKGSYCKFCGKHTEEDQYNIDQIIEYYDNY